MANKQRNRGADVPQANFPGAAEGTHSFRRNMLLALIALSVAAIAYGIYSSRSAITRAALPAAVSAPNGLPSGDGSLASFAAFYNFGTISMAAGNVTHRYSIRNVGQAPVTITRLTTSCMCTTATLVTTTTKRGPFGMPGHGPVPTIRERLAPGEKAVVEVVFDPAAHGPSGLGRIDRSVTIENDAAAPLHLKFSATVRP